MRISIIGLGLIGGSLGLALKAAKLASTEVIGFDLDRRAESEARRRGAIDRQAHNLRRAAEGVDLLILATPVLAIRDVMEEVSNYLPDGCTVTDTGSTKSAVMSWAAELLPAHIDFVGGHPLAGKEHAGIEAADGALFRGKAYCLIPSPRASEESVKLVRSLITTVGARELLLDAEEHDQYAAAVSHMPALLSVALFTLIRGSVAWHDLAKMASSGFKDLTRLASGDPTMSHDMLVTNREAVVHWVNRLISELAGYRTLLAADNTDELLERLAMAKVQREDFISGRDPAGDPSAAGAPALGDQFSSTSLLGGLLGDRLAARTRDLSPSPQRESTNDSSEDRMKRR